MPDEFKRLGAAFEWEAMRDQRLEPELAGFDELDNSLPPHAVRKSAEHLEIAQHNLVQIELIERGLMDTIEQRGAPGYQGPERSTSGFSGAHEIAREIYAHAVGLAFHDFGQVVRRGVDECVGQTKRFRLRKAAGRSAAQDDFTRSHYSQDLAGNESRRTVSHYQRGTAGPETAAAQRGVHFHIEDRCLFERDTVRNGIHVLLRHHQQVLACSIARDAELITVSAELATAPQTEHAFAAADHGIESDPVATFCAGNARAGFEHLTRKLVSEDQRRMHSGQPSIEDVYVGAADPHRPHPK